MSDHELDHFLQGIAGELKRPVRFDSQFDARVMAAIEEPRVLALPMERVQRSPRPWILRPRTFAVSPLAGILAAAALVGVIVMSAPSGESESRVARETVERTEFPVTPVANVTSAPVKAFYSHQFLLHAPQAASVTIVGDFNDWDESASPMTLASTDGVWSISLPLAAGRHEYQFVIDGKQRIADPAAPQATSDFDSPNSVVTVAGRTR